MEITANALQTVSVNNSVVFTDTPVPGNCSIIHREGSGLVTLRGLCTAQRRARFRASFGGNVALPTGQTAPLPIALAIAINGEPIATTTMISTPAAVERFENVSTEIFIDVPICTSYQISVKNVGTTPIEVINANLIVERVA